MLRSSWWVDFGYRGIRHRQRSPVNTKAGAEAFEAELRHRLLSGQPLDPERVRRETVPTFSAFAMEWLDTDVRLNCRVQTQRDRRITVERHLIPAFGRILLDRITEERVDAFRARKLAEGYNQGTVRRFLKTLRRCLRVAWRKGILSSPPRFDLPRAPMERRDHLHLDEVERLLGDTLEPRWNAMVRMALRTGMRVGELLALEWDDLDLATAVVTVQRTYSGGILSAPKTGEARLIPLTEDVLELIDALPRTGRYVFSANPDGPHSLTSASKALRRIAERTGTRPGRPFGWHVLRHSFATLALWSGADIRSVQSIMGHASIEMTARYSHVSTESLREAVRRTAEGPMRTRVSMASTRETSQSPTRDSSLSSGHAVR